MMVSARQLSLTPELAAIAERFEPDPGPEPGSEDHTPVEFEDFAERILSSNPSDRLHVFAYGSLIWNPEFEVERSARAVVRGWHRSFCMRLTRWRGTRELPALMMALDRGGSCVGLLYELRTDDHRAQVVRLLEREIDAKPPTNVPRWVWTDSGTERVRALTFVADAAGPAYSGRLPLAEVARITARAAGHWGSAATYLQRTVAKLEEHGIRDRNLWVLQDLVARHIREDHGLPRSP